MARYRPVANEHIWRNARCAGLTETARHALLYLLTGSFTNTIGAYPIQPSVAAAEMESVNADGFLLALTQLQARSLAYYANGYVIVSCWFLHNTWESTLQGKVQKAAKREFQQLPPEIQVRWIDSSIAAGVPADVIQAFIGKPLASPISHSEMGVVQKIDENTQQLAKALADGVPIIISTIQKFPFITQAIRTLEANGKGVAISTAGKRFAVIVDEAHSSQSGETAMELTPAYHG